MLVMSATGLYLQRRPPVAARRRAREARSRSTAPETRRRVVPRRCQHSAAAVIQFIGSSVRLQRASIGISIGSSPGSPRASRREAVAWRRHPPPPPVAPIRCASSVVLQNLLWEGTDGAGCLGLCSLRPHTSSSSSSSASSSSSTSPHTRKIKARPAGSTPRAVSSCSSSRMELYQSD
jgi:hypothetical protein